MASSAAMAQPSGRRGSGEQQDAIGSDVVAGEDNRGALLLDDGVDRSNWVERATKLCPDIQELRERIHPLHRAIAFGSLYNVGRFEVKQSLSRQTILQLIMQHLQYEGLKSTKKALEEESHIRAASTELKESALVALLRDALRDTEKVYEYFVGDRERIDKKTTIEDLIENLLAMGVEDDADLQEDVNIWDDRDKEDDVILEPPDPSAGPSDGLRTMKAASLNKLVERLTSEKGHDLKYMRTFLLTYQSFTKPDRLLLKLIQRYHVPKPANLESEDEWRMRVVRPIQLRVCNALKSWIERHFGDFNDKLIMNLNMFIDNTLSRDGHDKLANQLRGIVQKKLSGDTAAQKVVMFSEPPPEPIVPKNIFSSSLLWEDVDNIELARQLTIAEYDIYSCIKPSELLNQAWNKQKYKHRAHNVLALIHRFNQVSLWAASSIVRTERIRDRVRVWTRFIGIAEECRRLNNYNACMAILAGINNAACHRLKWTKKELQRKTQESFEEMEQLLSRDNNSRVYRETLHNSNPPCIPYLGVYLTDITFIEDGNPDLVKGLINFRKRDLVSNVIVEIQQYQLPYNLLSVHQIHGFLTKFRRVDEQELYKVSLKREPRAVTDRDEID